MNKANLSIITFALLALAAGPSLAQTGIASLGNQVDETLIKDQNAFDSTGPSDVRGAGAAWSGTNVGGVSFDRAFADCIGISGLGPVLGSEQPFYVDTTGAYDFSSTQSYDGYIHIYEGAFDPADAELNCVIGDDDGPGGIGTSEVLGVTLEANVQYIAVTSAFEAGDEGTFDNTITGAGGVFLGPPLPSAATVPTLSPLGMVAMFLVLGLIATIVLVRRES